MSALAATSEPRRSLYPWLLTILLLLAFLLNYLDRQVIFAIFPLLQTDFGLSAVQLGSLGTAFLWVYAFCNPVCGYLSDRVGYKWLIVSSLLVWSGVSWATAHASGYGSLLATRAIMGVSEACYLPAALALIASTHSERTRSRAMGIHYSGSYLGTILGGSVGGYTASVYGWRWMFAALGIGGILYAIVLAVTIRPDREVTPALERRTPLRLSKSLFSKEFRSVLIVFALLSLADWAVYAWMPFYLYEHFHLSLASAGFAATFYLKGGSILGVLFGGYLADRWYCNDARARWFTQSIALLLSAPLFFALARTASFHLLVVCMIGFGLCKGAYDCNVMPTLCEIVPLHLRSTAFSLVNFAGCFAGGMIAIIAGALKHAIGLGTIFASLAVVILIGGGILFHATRRQAAPAQ